MHRSLRSFRHTLKTPDPPRPRTPTRAFTFILPHPQLRSYAADHSGRPPANAEPTAQRSTQTFGRLSTWSTSLERTSLISVLIRGHEQRHFEVQCCLFSHAINRPEKAQLKISWPGKETKSVPMLDLTSFDTSASFIFLFWLYNRRLPELGRDFEVESAVERKPPAAPAGGKIMTGVTGKREVGLGAKRRKEEFNLGLIEAWMLGAKLRAVGFQNDVLKRLAVLLDREEEEAFASSDPNYSSVIAWARRAFEAGSTSRGAAKTAKVMDKVKKVDESEPDPFIDSLQADLAGPTCATPTLEDKKSGVDKVADMIEDAIDDLKPQSPNHNEEDIGRPLREFAVDVAAKRVHDVGYDGLLLTKSERDDLSVNPSFAAEVFAGLGGQIGTGGVLVTDMAMAYLVREEA